MNRLAWKLVQKLFDEPQLYGVKVEEMKNGAIVVDAGIEAKGGFQAGKLITEICMGGCGKAEVTYKRYGELELPSILIYTDHPVVATLGSQYAGWQINEEGCFAIGSGPARALAQRPKDICAEIGYKDDFQRAIVVLETDKQPPGKVIERIGKDCRVSPEKIVVIIAPTTSIAGATQVSGRIVETGIHKLRRLGLNPNAILYAWGCAPIAPVHPKFSHAMARTNDAILYGGTAYYVVDCANEEELKEITKKAPSIASEAYGKPFIKIFKEADYDFYKIDPDLFAPASIVMNNSRTGSVFKNGEINNDLLRKSFGFGA